MRFTGEASPTIMVHLAMIGWFPICLMLFARLGATKAVIIGLVAGYFALPNSQYEFSGLPEYDKIMATSFVVACCAFVFDSKRVMSFRPEWIDLPVAILCLAPFLSVMREPSLNTWRGLSDSFTVCVQWGLPWLLGRLYISTPRAQLYFAKTLVVAALIYLPFAAYEIWASPRMHEIVYGIKLKSFKHAKRGIGWRPNVFLEHGLLAAMVLSMSGLSAFWLWMTKSVREVFGIPIGVVFFGLAGLSVASQSFAAVVFLGVGVGVLLVVQRMQWRGVFLTLVLIPPIYIGVRHALGWEAAELVETAKAIFGPDRARSLQTRLEAENMLRDRAWRKPLLGWADFTLYTGNDPKSGSMTVLVDSLWILILGLWGYVGLFGTFGALLIGPWLLWKKLPARLWGNPRFAPMVVLALIVLLYSLDSLLNAFANPIFIAPAGGVACALGTPEGRARLMA